MMFPILTTPTAHAGKKGKITCITCQLKKCVGRCRFEPAPPRAA